MEKFIKGDVVILPFPFSDLSTSKKRPALVVANLIGNDLILCQITSQSRDDKDAITLRKNDFQEGNLPVESFIRPSRLFTADSSIIIYKIGRLIERKIKEIEDKLCEIFKR